jgi:lactoylglutathione lyase
MEEKQMSGSSAPSVHTGVILKTERFDACVRFYHDLLGLPLWWEKPDLCCLRFGSGYLMVERKGVATDSLKSVLQNPTVLRFHVPDIETAADALRQQEVAVEILRFDWGVIGVFADPDGNPCELAELWDDA